MIGVLLPIVGRHLVLGRMVLLGLAIPQLAMAGMALVFLGAARHWGWAAALMERCQCGCERPTRALSRAVTRNPARSQPGLQVKESDSESGPGRGRRWRAAGASTVTGEALKL